MAPPTLPLEAGIAAVRLARAEAEAEVLRQRARRAGPVPGLEEVRGTFVSVLREGELRGCVGFPEPSDPLHRVVPEAARQAVRDPRFEPLRPREVGLATFEVSVLTPPRPLAVPRPEELPGLVRVGEHGLVVRAGRRKGLLLPQVAMEHGLTAEGFLSACCAKAGLDPEAWRWDGLQWHVFEAQAFRELTSGGPVLEASHERPDVA